MKLLRKGFIFKTVHILLALVCLFQSGASISENVYLGVKSIHVMSQLLVNFVVKVLKLEYVRQTGILYECFNNLDMYSLKRHYFQCCIFESCYIRKYSLTSVFVLDHWLMQKEILALLIHSQTNFLWEHVDNSCLNTLQTNFCDLLESYSNLYVMFTDKHLYLCCLRIQAFMQ